MGFGQSGFGNTAFGNAPAASSGGGGPTPGGPTTTATLTLSFYSETLNTPQMRDNAFNTLVAALAATDFEGIGIRLPTPWWYYGVLEDAYPGVFVPQVYVVYGDPAAPAGTRPILQTPLNIIAPEPLVANPEQTFLEAVCSGIPFTAPRGTRISVSYYRYLHEYVGGHHYGELEYTVDSGGNHIPTLFADSYSPVNYVYPNSAWEGIVFVAVDAIVPGQPFRVRSVALGWTNRIDDDRPKTFVWTDVHSISLAPQRESYVYIPSSANLPSSVPTTKHGISVSLSNVRLVDRKAEFDLLQNVPWGRTYPFSAGFVPPRPKAQTGGPFEMITPTRYRSPDPAPGGNIAYDYIGAPLDTSGLSSFTVNLADYFTDVALWSAKYADTNEPVAIQAIELVSWAQFDVVYVTKPERMREVLLTAPKFSTPLFLPPVERETSWSTLNIEAAAVPTVDLYFTIRLPNDTPQARARAAEIAALFNDEWSGWQPGYVQQIFGYFAPELQAEVLTVSPESIETRSLFVTHMTIQGAEPEVVDEPVALTLRLSAPTPEREQQARDSLAALFAPLTPGQAAPTPEAIAAQLLVDGVAATVLEVVPATATDGYHRLVLGPVTFEAPEPQLPGASVFQVALGTKQGRIQIRPGKWAYELGHADCIVELAEEGDRHAIVQEVPVAQRGGSYARVHLAVQTPKLRPGGSKDVWLLSVARGGTTFYLRPLLAQDRTITIDDMVVPWRGETNDATIEIALTLLGG